MRYLLDTNICIYLIKKHPAKVLQRLREQNASQVGVSTITVAELEFGVAKSARPEQNQEALQLFLAPLEIVLFDSSAAVHYGRIRTVLEKNGSPIGSMDLLIAAHALSLGVLLVTNNEREFSRVPGLKLENWAS
jgi:tRNA(fMet)-specific endonuclease VapC